MDNNIINLMPDPMTLEERDYESLRQSRQDRVKLAMEEVDPGLMKQVLNEEQFQNLHDRAAISIQKHYRGYKDRKLYEAKLYDLFLKEEDERMEKIHQQVEEGELLIDNHKLDVLLDDDSTTRKNKDRQYLSKIITLQRAWKAHLQKKQIDEEETSDTESFKGAQAAFLSTPEENQQDVFDKFSLCPDKKFPMKQLRDTETDSVSSDYSEVTGALQDIADSELDIIDKADLSNTSLDLTKITSRPKGPVSRLPGESDEKFCKRVKKINFLSLAQEFEELKKKNTDATPYEIHMKTTANKPIDLADVSDNAGKMDTGTCNVLPPSIKIQDETDVKVNNNSDATSSGSVIDNKRFESEDSMNISGDFEVYNIENALPPIDWETLEKQIKLASIQATAQKEKKLDTRQADRETIRQKLAFGGDEEYYYNERAFKKPNFQTRLQSGMNLQICFMNEAMNEAGNQDVTVNGQSIIKKEPKIPAKKIVETKRDSPPKKDKSTKSNKDEEDTKTSRLKEEAKIALAQASTMAHMQLEVERQLKKKSPVADMVGIPTLGDGRQKKFNRKLLDEMNLAQIQVLVNDVHTQIENLNEELVHLLIERDDLHMEQDSMLVDVEDLTRYVTSPK